VGLSAVRLGLQPRPRHGSYIQKTLQTSVINLGINF